MKTYTYSEARQRLARLLDEAQRDGQVRIRRQDGSVFVLQSIAPSGSPLDVPGVRPRLRPGELADLLRAERRRSAAAVLEALPGRKGAGRRERAR